MKCPICNSVMMENECLTGKTNTPNILKKYGGGGKEVSLQLYHCEVCGHGAIEDILTDDFYEEFTVALDDKKVLSAANTRNIRFEKLLSKLVSLGKNNGSLLEVGSGCGYLLKAAEGYYQEAVGVEPSKTEAEIACKMGLNVICDYFTAGIAFEKPFSAFISTMVFEHLPNPKEAIQHIFNNLESGGIGMIQVPNGQRAISNGIYFDIYPQHLHYYTPLSLCKLVTDTGFEVISIEETGNRNYIEMYVRKPEQCMGFCDRAKHDTEYIMERIAEHKVAAVWGASYAARSYMRFLQGIQYIFDVSASKIGGYIVGSDIKISYPEEDKVSECDLIIIMANEYTEEIEKSICQNYKFSGEIIYFNQENDICSKWINKDL